LTASGGFEDNRFFPALHGKERDMGKEAKFVVRLTDEERLSLQELIGRPHVAADKALRARMLLKADVAGPDWPDSQIAEAFEVGLSTVHRLRQRLVEEGLEAALSRRPSTHRREPKLDGAKEARLVTLACGRAPRGQVLRAAELHGARIALDHIVGKGVV
jgi:transposase